MSDYERFLESLKTKRAPSEAHAAALIRKAQGKDAKTAEAMFDEAEAEVRRVDDSIYGAVAISRMYQARLSEMISQGMLKKHKAEVEAMYRRALRWAWSCYPDPHTEYEADDYEKGRQESHAALVKLMGYDPGTNVF